MTVSRKPPVIQPTPLPLSATGSTRRRHRRVIHRVRLEHLAVELLRITGTLRLPVPVEALWQNPPNTLWDKPSAETIVAGATPAIKADTYPARWEAAVKLAVAAGSTLWSPKVRLLGEAPFTDADVYIFARALLVPTPLIARLSERQKTLEMIHTIFQAPLEEVEIRLEGLGML